MNDLTTRFLNNFTQWHEVGLTLINRYSLCSYSIESRFARFLGQFLVNFICEIQKQKQL